MTWKQTIELVFALGLMVVLCFAVIFPVLYDLERPGKLKELEAGNGPPSAEEGKDVLPDLKGVSWKSPKEKASDNKAARENAEKAPEKKRIREEFEALAEEAPEGEAAASAGAEEPPGEALLELEEVSWYEQGGYAVATGTVKNISSRSLPSVVIHVRFLDEALNPLVSEHSLIDLNPIFPGQVSAFSVAARFHPRIKDVDLDFTLFSGAEIPWRKVKVEENGDFEEGEPAGDDISEDEPVPESEGLPPEAADPLW